MDTDRRHFLKAAALGSMLGGGLGQSRVAGAETTKRADPATLDRICETDVLVPRFLERPVVVESIELLLKGRTFLVRARSKDGVESVTAPNSDRMRDVYPVFLNRVAPFFVGKDACRIESLLGELYRADSNYKLQGLGLWVPVAAVEMALLDLIGRSRGIALGELFGPVLRRDIAVYRASGNRGNRPEEEIEYLKQIAAETGAKALKFRLGGRMSRNADFPPGRTEALIPLARAAFPDFTLYGDANSSYDVANAIRIGRLLEEHRYAFFEEPVPFDDLWATREVTHALTLPVAGGEQEFSLRRFRWMIEQRGVDVVQPDLHYFGGFIRSVKVARMAAAAGLTCTPHMSGSGLGYLNVLHFASVVPHVGPHQEFKGDSDIPCVSETSSLRCERGVMRCPSGPGMGVSIDPTYVRTAAPVKSV
jgi:L-alanine-DL-glutamate epimerase-like enolase superfamily enzyme